MSIRNIAWALTPEVAPAIRFLQDQQIRFCSDRNGGFGSGGTFVQSVADWCSQMSRITPRQVSSIAGIIADRGWIEPPRWRPYAAVESDRYVVHACPGAADRADIEALVAECPVGMDCRIDIGALTERTWDAADARRGPSYIPIVWRLVGEARVRGRIIGDFFDRPVRDRIPCFRHRLYPDWVRRPDALLQPAGTDTRLTPEPLRMLENLAAGAALRERVGDWTITAC